jgi:hypothetical protein
MARNIAQPIFVEINTFFNVAKKVAKKFRLFLKTSQSKKSPNLVTLHTCLGGVEWSSSHLIEVQYLDPGSNPARFFREK